jgi:phytanoyl-CoA hydroxylase
MNILNFDKLKKDYRKNGWVLVKKIFLKKEVQEINKKIDFFLKKNLKKYKGKNINFVGNNNSAEDIKKINSFHKLADSLYIRKKSQNKKIRTIAKLLLDSKVKFIASELFAKPAQNGLPSPMHQDNFYWCIKGGNALTVWVALDKVSSINGGLQYYNKTHALGLIEHEPSHSKGSSQKVSNIEKYKKFKKVCPKLNPGDALFHHSQIIHGSSANSSGIRRRGLTFQFKDYFAKYDSILKRYYLRSLNQQMNSRNT